MKKGFTLIELLVVVAIIGIISSVLLASLHTARCKSNPKKEGCDTEQKTEVPTSKVADKFDRSDDSETDYSQVTDFGCSQIPVDEGRAECEKQTYNAKMIEECISRYSDN